MLWVFALDITGITSLKTEAHGRQMLRHHHSRHPEHCAPMMPAPEEPPSQLPSLPPMVVGPSAVGLPPGYQLTPFHVHACNSPCSGPNDCYWPCMACCPNSTCCDR